MTHSQEIVDSLRKQYTLNNDGAGLDGRCRVSNKDLLELLRLVEQTEQQNAELKEQSSRLANESVRQAQQNADLCVKNAELLNVIKWANNHGGLGYSIHGEFEKAIAKESK